MDLKDEIESTIRQVASESGKELVEDFGEKTVLLESGLDSLDFAIVVARLEESLDADPFSVMEEPVYPRTFAEFTSIYEKHLSSS